MVFIEKKAGGFFQKNTTFVADNFSNEVMMKMKLMVLSIAVASLLVPVLSWANWNDPTLTADWKKAVLGLSLIHI